MQDITLRDVKWHPKTSRISQIPKEGLEFAMLSPDYEQLNQLVWCKDFMQDLIWSYLNKRKIDIYGFCYDPEVSPAPSLKRVRLLITNYKDHEFGNRLANSVLPLIHSVESRLKMSKTVLEKCRTAPPIYKKAGVYILDGSKRWLKSTPMLSFYTMLIRTGMVHQQGDTLEQTLEKIKIGEVQPYYDKYCRDREMIVKANNGIENILRHSDHALFPAKIQKNYPVHYNESGYFSDCQRHNISIYDIHDRCGLVGFSEGKTKEYFPNWRHPKGESK